MQPKVKDIQVIADVIVSQATAMQPERESVLSDESSPNSLKTLHSNPRRSKERTRTRQKRPRSGRANPDSPRHSNNYQRAYSLRSASPQSDIRPAPVKMASAEDLYTDVDKFTYTADLSSLTAKVDIDSLTNQRKSDAKTKGKTKSVQLSDTIRNSLLQESDKLLCALGLTKQDIYTLATGDNNNDGDSLFDDPDLLKGLPSVATSPPAAAFHHTEKKEKEGDTTRHNTSSPPPPPLPVDATCANKDNDEKELMKMMREFVANANNASNEPESLESMKNNELDASKEKILHRRLVSESEYANLLRHLQKRDDKDTPTQQVHLSDTEKTRINAAKEMFKHGRNSLLFREQSCGKEYTRPARFDLKADLEYNKHINLLLQQTLAKTGKTSNSHDLEPMVLMGPTSKRTNENMQNRGLTNDNLTLGDTTNCQNNAELKTIVNVDALQTSELK